MAYGRERVKRFFAAIDVDEPTREEIVTISAAARETFSGGSRRIRVTWVRRDRLHVTLEFFGEVDQTDEHRIRAALAEPFSVPSFDLRFDGLGFFPSSGPPRVLWLGIAQGANDLRAVHAELACRLRAPGKRDDDFSPHLTLARFRNRISRSALTPLEALAASAGPCRIDRVTLYESRLSPEGPAYVEVQEALLQSCM